MTWKGRKRNYRRKRYKTNHYKKGTRSAHTVAKIAQAVVNHNLETKYQDQYCVDYPGVALNHNVISQVFDNLTFTAQGVENKPGSKLRSFNRIGSSIAPTKLWIRGLLELEALASGFPITKCMYRVLVIRRPMATNFATALPLLPTSIPHNVTTESQTSLTLFPNNFLTNFDNRVNTVVYDHVFTQKVTALIRQTPVSPAATIAWGNTVSLPFNINLDMGKLTGHSVDYSFDDTALPPSGIGLPKKFCYQMYVVPWVGSGYDPAYEFTVRVGRIIAMSRLYFKDG